MSVGEGDASNGVRKLEINNEITKINELKQGEMNIETYIKKRNERLARINDMRDGAKLDEAVIEQLNMSAINNCDARVREDLLREVQKGTLRLNVSVDSMHEKLEDSMRDLKMRLSVMYDSKPKEKREEASASIQVARVANSGRGQKRGRESDGQAGRGRKAGRTGDFGQGRGRGGNPLHVQSYQHSNSSGRFPGACFYCKRSGHKEQDCWFAKKDGNSRGGGHNGGRSGGRSSGGRGRGWDGQSRYIGREYGEEMAIIGLPTSSFH